jgi:hypothetical protein
MVNGDLRGHSRPLESDRGLNIANAPPGGLGSGRCNHRAWRASSGSSRSAPGPEHIFDDEPLTQRARRVPGHDAGHHVSRSAGRIRRDQRDRARRIVLRRAASDACEERGNCDGASQVSQTPHSRSRSPRAAPACGLRAWIARKPISIELRKLARRRSLQRRVRDRSHRYMPMHQARTLRGSPADAHTRPMRDCRIGSDLKGRKACPITRDTPPSAHPSPGPTKRGVTRVLHLA